MYAAESLLCGVRIGTFAGGIVAKVLDILLKRVAEKRSVEIASMLLGEGRRHTHGDCFHFASRVDIPDV